MFGFIRPVAAGYPSLSLFVPFTVKRSSNSTARRPFVFQVSAVSLVNSGWPILQSLSTSGNLIIVRQLARGWRAEIIGRLRGIENVPKLSDGAHGAIAKRRAPRGRRVVNAVVGRRDLRRHLIDACRNTAHRRIVSHILSLDPIRSELLIARRGICCRSFHRVPEA